MEFVDGWGNKYTLAQAGPEQWQVLCNGQQYGSAFTSKKTAAEILLKLAKQRGWTRKR